MLARAPLSRPLVCEIQPAMAHAPNRRGRPRAVAEDGIEFLFAQFVDMHAKPSAKLVPAQQLDGLLADGAGFAGFAAGDIGQTPDNPDLIAMPDVGHLHPAALEAGDRLVRLRRHGGGRGLALLPAHDPAPPARARPRGRATSSRSAASSSTSSSAETEDGGIEVADPLDTLEQPCYDIRALTRSFDFVSDVMRQRQLARLGDVRHRPRGRQRAVRAELRLRRRAHHLRPRGVLPLHGRGDGPGARPDRDLHAEAVRPPDRQRLRTST